MCHKFVYWLAKTHSCLRAHAIVSKDALTATGAASCNARRRCAALQMDTATKSVQTNNQKMKGVLTRIRSGRNFCIDIILITVLLAIAGFIYTQVS